MKQLFQFFSVLCLGIFSGAMFVIAAALIPYWNSLSPTYYRESFQIIGPFLGHLMVPLLALSIGLTLAALFSSPKATRKLWVGAFILVFGIAPLYVIFSAPINELLLGTTELSSEIIAKLRDKWVLWHWTRTIAGTIAFTLSLVAFGNWRAR